MAQQLVSIIVPLFNEAPNLEPLYQEINKHTRKLPYDFELIFVDDGSTDDSAAVARGLANVDKKVRFLGLSRNFGKEAAMTAGLHSAKGDAAIILDADLQHPPNIIRKFLQKWRGGAEVVIGVKEYGKSDSRFKRWTSNWFYKLLQPMSDTEITPHAADYRLLDRRVINAFGDLKEHNRITRGLIDWLGFRRDYVKFDVMPRRHGERSYSFPKLFSLAVNSFTSFSLMPLKLAGYLGNIILFFTIPGGLFLVIEMYVLNDPLSLEITSAGMLALLNLLLIGVVLACLGLIALYIAKIHAEVTNRPLYVVRDNIGKSDNERQGASA